MSGFADKLAALCAGELAHAKRDPERMGAMLETMARSLGFTIAVAAHGDPHGIDELCAGAEGYVHSEAVQKAPFARLTTPSQEGE